MRRLLATTVLVVGLLVLVPTPGVAQSDDDAQQTTTTTEPASGGNIIPEPNSGSEPDDAGDRGGALQTALFVGIVVAIAGGVALVVRQSRQARAERGY